MHVNQSFALEIYLRLKGNICRFQNQIVFNKQRPLTAIQDLFLMARER